MTWQVSFRDHEAASPAVPLDWDTALVVGDDGPEFDWLLAPQDARPDSGGLAARAAIATAVILSLFTDARAPEGWRPDVQDRRGWWADGLNPDGVEPMGSWLWTALENGVATVEAARDAQAEAARALAWMERDGIAGAVLVSAAAVPADRQITLSVEVVSPSGERLFAGSFGLLWQQVV